jgi:pimeloyl-ACP methyl ester carboxylesterase
MDFMNRRTVLTTLAGSALARPAFARAPDGDEAASRRYAHSRRRVRLRSGVVSYIDEGSGPAALLLHGFPLSNFQWRDVIPGLTHRRRCLAPDWLGLGQTRVAEGASVAPAAQCAMLVDFLDRLDVASVDIIANDSGGAVAQLFAVAHPGRVRSLLLTNCDVEPDSPPEALKPVIELARAGTYADAWLAPWASDPALARSPQGLGGMC